MEALKKTLFVLSVVMVTSYTIRHIYLKWVEPRSSVLDKYKNPTANDIENATSLEQLEKFYADAHKQVLTYDAIDSIKAMDHYERSKLEPYRNKEEARQAIIAWESQTAEIFKIRFYWAIGMVLVLVGFFLYTKVNAWLGITLLITGFAQMVYWTSPSFFYGAEFEYNRLLTNKIVLSFFTLASLILGGFFTHTLKSK